eukprot:TRINITY_DN5049_c0_g1_i1.p1 TRINITY_DN5049_c0_g1~~TRINITY_DN5049_c0_g1_i1.p1  ORF type:complete len:506 (-),score=54.68 TRINITY_DN5049_c0_g1_i1:1559-3076(-)
MSCRQVCPKSSFLSYPCGHQTRIYPSRLSRRQLCVFAGKTYRPPRKKKKINPQDLYITFPQWEKMDTPKLMRMPQADLDDLLDVVGIPKTGSKQEQIEKLQIYLKNLNSQTYIRKTTIKRKEKQQEQLRREIQEAEKQVKMADFEIEENCQKPMQDGKRYQVGDLKTGLGVTWLGTSSGAPSNTRNVSCIAFRTPECTLLVDCGEGTYNQLQCYGIDPFSIKAVFITHLHGDHVFGIPGLVNYLGAYHQAKKAYSGSEDYKDDFLTIYGPPGLHKLFASAFSYTNAKAQLRVDVYEYVTESDGTKEPQAVDPTGMIRFGKLGPKPADGPVIIKGKLKGVHIVEGSFWEIQTDYGVTVTSSQLIHRLPCWGYVFQENKDNGRKVVLLGDTCNSDALIPAAKDADMLSHEATFCKGLEAKAKHALHSTAEMAGNFARRINAKALLLTHFSSRYKVLPMQGDGEEVVQDVDQNRSDIAQLVNQAQYTFGYDSVYAAYDGLTYHVPPRK